MLTCKGILCKCVSTNDVENVVKNSISGQKNTHKQSQRNNLHQACYLFNRDCIKRHSSSSNAFMVE